MSEFDTKHYKHTQLKWIRESVIRFRESFCSDDSGESATAFDSFSRVSVVVNKCDIHSVCLFVCFSVACLKIS